MNSLPGQPLSTWLHEEAEKHQLGCFHDARCKATNKWTCQVFLGVGLDLLGTCGAASMSLNAGFLSAEEVHLVTTRVKQNVWLDLTWI